MRKRTRHVRNYFLTVPRIAVEGRILEIRMKVTQVVIQDLGPARRDAHRPGEIERGSIDAEEAESGVREN